ncbi:MAG TPA: hypothetical protein VHE59_05095 [Mucilaginibacter sp.]|nr:hypothetical protein [Mucilaginibacter sp.]
MDIVFSARLTTGLAACRLQKQLSSNTTLRYAINGVWSGTVGSARITLT